MAASNQVRGLLDLPSIHTDSLAQENIQDPADIEQYLTNLKKELREIGEYLLALASIDIDRPAQQDVRDLVKIQVEQYYIRSEVGECELDINLKHLPVKKPWFKEESERDNVTSESNAGDHDAISASPNPEDTLKEVEDNNLKSNDSDEQSPTEMCGDGYYGSMHPDFIKKESDAISPNPEDTIEDPEEVHHPLFSAMEQEETPDFPSDHTEQNIPGVSYMEQETPDDDEFIFCQDCNLAHPGDCPIHGGLTIVKDREAPADGSDPLRAQNTLPPSLVIKKSTIPEAGRGVFSTEVIPKGTRFGPFEGVPIGGADSVSRCSWENYTHGELSHYIDVCNQSLSNWMHFVNSPSQRDQQNLTVFQNKGGIYYHTMVDIPQDTELLVCYGDQCELEPPMTGRDTGQDTGSLQKYINTQASKPELIEVSKLELPKLSKPELVKPSKPKLIEPSKPKLIEPSKPKLIELSKPKLLEPSKPEVMETSRSNTDSMSRDLQRHQRTLTGEKPYICGVCGAKFKQHESLRVHHSSHIGENPCMPKVMELSKSELVKPLKPKVIEPSNPKLIEHSKMILIESPKPKLNEASKTKSIDLSTPEIKSSKPSQPSISSTSSDLQIHQTTLTGEKPYICVACGAEFKQRESLRVHLIAHIKEKARTCRYCGQKFSRPAERNRHHMSHTGERPYPCNMCGKRFSRLCNLQTHQRRHTGEKPYTCSVCGKGFVASCHLSRHQRTHSRKTIN